MSSRLSKAFFRKVSSKSKGPKDECVAVSYHAVTAPDLQPAVTLAVVGCGQRGRVCCSLSQLLQLQLTSVAQAYSDYALQFPDRCKVVAIAEPRPETRKAFAKEHSVDQTLVFTTWEHLLEASQDTVKTVGKRLADAILVAVQDCMHLQVAAAFAKQGYHILCEKPMATTVEECIEMETVVKQAGVIFGMGHGGGNCYLLSGPNG